MKKLTLQQVFDNAWNGIFGPTQNGNRCVSREGGTVCAYQSPDTLKHCAIGWSIPLGHPAMNNDGAVGETLKEHEDIAWLFSDIDITALSDLQEAHDHSKNPEEMRDELILFAREYCLEIPQYA